MGIRRKAREIALSFLFEIEYHDVNLDEFLKKQRNEKDLKEDVVLFAKDLVQNFQRNQSEVDNAINNHSSNWKVSRMARVDRNLLRLGSVELLFFPEIPKSVSINEYLEIAKKFGSEDSASFINGILDKIQKKS